MNKATKALAEMGQVTSNTMFSVVEYNQNGTDRKKAENGKDAISDIFICDQPQIQWIQNITAYFWWDITSKVFPAPKFTY